jgi:3-dehydroquinate dehydratase-1
MNPVITIRQKEFGRGTPNLCIPITETNLEGLGKIGRLIAKTPHDMVEWRADFFHQVRDAAACCEALTLLRTLLPNDPILFTIRTQPEMGEITLSAEKYVELNLHVIEDGIADLIDVELSFGDEIVQHLIEAAHRKGVYVLVSRHDKEGTPSTEQIVSTLSHMQTLGADLVKFAVMPHTSRDVLKLLDATLTMQEHHADTPVVTMAMGRLGALSRVSGELFGSAITFGALERASAPGQLPAEQLSLFLKALHLESKP